MVPYNFEGDVTLFKNIPSDIDLTIEGEQSNAIISYNLVHDDSKRAIKAKITQNDDFVSIESELYIESLIDWAYNVKILSSRDEFNELMLSTTLTPVDKKNVYETSFEMVTPWQKYLVDKINITSLINLNPSDGDIKLFYEISKFNGESGCEWKYLQKQQKQDYQFKIHVDSKERGKHMSTQFAYVNAPKTPTDVSFAIDINSIWK
jgi:hypothetical protein